MKRILQLLLIFFIIIIFLLISVKIFNIDRKVLMNFYPNEYSSLVEQYSDEYKVDKDIIFAIIKSESNFENEVLSNKGAKGLMQLMESTAMEVADILEIENINLADAKTNILLGTKYFSMLYEKYNNIELALAAYNAGTGNVDKWIENGIISESGENVENIPFKETNMYVRKVMHSKEIYEFLYD